MDEVEKSLLIFEKKIGTRRILRALHDGLIDRNGQLDSETGYEIHGSGCCMLYDNYEVDFDFYAPGKVGFDHWRLWRFSKQFPLKYTEYSSWDDVKQDFQKLISEGSIILAPGNNDRLYVVNNGM